MNPQPTDYKSVALPLRHTSMSGEGFDEGGPVTRRLPMCCSRHTPRCLYSITIGVRRSGVAFLASEERVCYIRDCSLPFQLGWHTILALPRVGAGDTLPLRCFYADYFKLTKVKCHWPWFPLTSAHTSNLYRAVMQCARATEMALPVAHGYGPPGLFMRPLRNTSSHAKRASSTVFLASADVASFLSASTNHCVYLWSGPTLPHILCHQPDREFLMVRHVTLFPNISLST